MTKRNVKNILKLAKFIETKLTDDTFDYNSWFFIYDQDNHPAKWIKGQYANAVNVKDIYDHPCGTAGCIAGWACILDARASHKKYVIESDIVSQSNAQEWLGLMNQEARTLFYGNWSLAGTTASRLAVVAYLRDTVASGRPIESIYDGLVGTRPYGR